MLRDDGTCLLGVVSLVLDSFGKRFKERLTREVAIDQIIFGAGLTLKVTLCVELLTALLEATDT